MLPCLTILNAQGGRGEAICSASTRLCEISVLARRGERIVEDDERRIFFFPVKHWQRHLHIEVICRLLLPEIEIEITY